MVIRVCLSVGGTFGGYVILQNMGGIIVGFVKKSERLLKNYAGNVMIYFVGLGWGLISVFGC